MLILWCSGVLPGYINVAGIVLVFFTIGESCGQKRFQLFFLWHMILWFCRNTKKAREPYHCSFHNWRPSHCPSSLNEQTCRGLTRNMNTPTSKRSRASISDGYTYPQGHLPFAPFLTKIKKVAKFPIVKKERQVNAFYYVWSAAPPRFCPRPGLCGMRSASAKLLINSK